MNIAQRGLDFFITCYNKYWGNENDILVLFWFSLFYVALKNRRLWKGGLWDPFIVGMLTIFNPLLMNVVLEKTFFYDRYYRFYWIIPIGIIVAVSTTDILSEIGKHISKTVMVLICILSISIFWNAKMPAFSSGWNMYQANNEVIELSKIIHTDTKEDVPTVFYPVQLVSMYREYDANVESVLGRGDCVSIVYPDLHGWIYDKYYNQGEYLLLLGNYGIEMSVELINTQLQDEGVDYFIRYKKWYSDDYISCINGEKIGETYKYEVYKIND